MQMEILLLTLTASIVIVLCTVIIIRKFVHYKRNRDCFAQRMEKNRSEEEILESRLSEIKLKNTGNSIDINVNELADDKDVFFAMRWSDIIETNNV